MLPVEAQATTLAPIMRACVKPAAIPLSLNEPEGLNPSYCRKNRSSSKPKAPASASARRYAQIVHDRHLERELIRASASGDLQGEGLWELGDTPEGTLARYTWRVTLDKAWMRALAPLLRPLDQRTTKPTRSHAAGDVAHMIVTEAVMLAGKA